MNISKCKLIDLPKITNKKGNLTVIEENNHIPFELKRIYYVYDTPKGGTRGAHAHKNLQQLIIATSGSFDVVLDDGIERKVFHLDRPDRGLYVCPMIWHELNNFASGTVGLVLASDIYHAEDYMTSYETFKKMVSKNGK